MGDKLTDEDNSLEYYEKAGYHSPEDAGGLIGNRTASVKRSATVRTDTR